LCVLDEPALSVALAIEALQVWAATLRPVALRLRDVVAAFSQAMRERDFVQMLAKAEAQLPSSLAVVHAITSLETPVRLVGDLMWALQDTQLSPHGHCDTLLLPRLRAVAQSVAQSLQFMGAATPRELLHLVRFHALLAPTPEGATQRRGGGAKIQVAALQLPVRVLSNTRRGPQDEVAVELPSWLVSLAEEDVCGDASQYGSKSIAKKPSASANEHSMSTDEPCISAKEASVPSGTVCEPEDAPHHVGDSRGTAHEARDATALAHDAHDDHAREFPRKYGDAGSAYANGLWGGGLGTKEDGEKGTEDEDDDEAEFLAAAAQARKDEAALGEYALCGAFQANVFGRGGMGEGSVDGGWDREGVLWVPAHRRQECDFVVEVCTRSLTRTRTHACARELTSPHTCPSLCLLQKNTHICSARIRSQCTCMH